MSYAIFRCQGIKTLKDLSQIGSHNKREKDSYKSNPDIRKFESINNIELIKCDKKYIEKFYDITFDYRKEVEEKMKNERQDRKKSFYKYVSDSKSVVADEMIFTSDQEFFNNLSKEEILNWANESINFILEDLGYKKEQILHATLHMDEKTPHIHCVVIPLVKRYDNRSKKEKYSISKRHYIKDKVHLSQLQDKYYNRLINKGFCLQRGDKNTGIKNLSVKQLKGLTKSLDNNLKTQKHVFNKNYYTLLKEMKNTKTNLLNNKIYFNMDTYNMMIDYLNTARDIIKNISSSEQLYNDLEKEIQFYKKFLLVNDEKDKEIKHLKNEIERLENKYNYLNDFITTLLQNIKKLFKQILNYGKEEDKNLVISQIEKCYVNNFYNENDLTFISNNTNKEKIINNIIEEKEYDLY